MSTVPTPDGDLIISLEHDPSGAAAWADMWDSRVLGWIVDDRAASDLAQVPRTQPQTQPQPAIIGALPPPAPDTAPVISPQWVSVYKDQVIVPNQWRGPLDQLFTWLATNNGAQRQLRGNFLNPDIVNVWRSWTAHNAALVWPGP